MLSTTLGFHRAVVALLIVTGLVAAGGSVACSSPSTAKDQPAQAATPPSAELMSSAPGTGAPPPPPPPPTDLPQPDEPEFRGVFVTSAYNMDWPSKPGLHWRAQRDEMDAIINRVAEMKCNVIILQVRAFGDRIHRTSAKHYKKEPWSEALNHRQDPHGHPTNKKYDPFAEWLHRCHEKGIELHVWVNPFRADALIEHEQNKHLPVQAEPRKGLYLQIDPHSTKAQKYLIDEIEELIDYKVKHSDLMSRTDEESFPPIREELASATMANWMMLMQGEEGGPDGVLIDHDLPGEPPPTGNAAAQAQAAAAPPPPPPPNAEPTYEEKKQKRIAWLVSQQKPDTNDTSNTNLDQFIAAVWAKCNDKKVKFGYSPTAAGSLTSANWLSTGKMDYVVPELYMDDIGDFGAKLGLWVTNNTFNSPDRKPYIVAGLHSNRVQSPPEKSDDPWQAQIILDQVNKTHKTATNPTEAKGQAFYSWSAMRKAPAGGPADNIGDKLTIAGAPYEKRALLPPARTGQLEAPTVNFDQGNQRWTWEMPHPPGDGDVRFWAVWQKKAGGWDNEVTVYAKSKMELKKADAPNAVAIAVMAVDGFNQKNKIGRSP